MEEKASSLEKQIESVGNEIRQLKLEKAEKTIVDEKVSLLKGLKTELEGIQRSLASTRTTFDRVKFEEMVKKRFFYTPSFSIYNGVKGLYDYGPPGCSLQANIIQLWRNHFILEEQMLEVDCTMLTPEAVLKTSGHVDRFTDLMVSDRVTGDFFRADHLLEGWLEDAVKDPKCDRSRREEYEKILAQIDGFGQKELGEMLQKYGVKVRKEEEEDM